MSNWIKNLFSPKPAILTTCESCNYYFTGHIDRRVNYMHCAKEHRLIADKDMKIVHRPYGDPDDKAIRVTQSGWCNSSTKTEAVMLGRLDCPNWKGKKSRLDLGNPEYD